MTMSLSRTVESKVHLTSEPLVQKMDVFSMLSFRPTVLNSVQSSSTTSHASLLLRAHLLDLPPVLTMKISALKHCNPFVMQTQKLVFLSKVLLTSSERKAKDTKFDLVEHLVKPSKKTSWLFLMKESSKLVT